MMTEPNLIRLPTGTEKRGLHLVPPHGMLIADQLKTQIAKARPFDMSGSWILVSGGKAYGTVEVELPVPISADAFDQRFEEHCVSKHERTRWWKDKRTLYLSAITSFKPFEKRFSIQVEPGMQTVVEKVEFIGDEPESLSEHYEQVRLLIEAREAEKGAADMLPEEAVSLSDVIDEPIIVEDSAGGETLVEPTKALVLPPHIPNALDMLQSRIHRSFTVVADDLLAWGYVSEQQRIRLSGAIGTALETFIREVEALESEIEGLPSLGEELRHTALDPAHALLLASKEKNPMPYDPKNPPAKVRGMPPKAQRIWVHAYNSAHEKYPKDEGRCHKIANGAVKNAGYYQDAQGKWHARKDEKAESKNLWGWLKERFDTILGDLHDGDRAPAPGERLFMTFKGKDGRPWLVTWTMNAFKDREDETFRTTAIEEYVARHADDEVKGEYWFWHLPGAKMAEIHWQAVVGRFLVELGPFDDTPIGRKLAEFFSQHPHDHPEIAPEGWGTSHGYYYVPADRKDKIYDWFDKFETTVLPRSAASNQHSPRMEVLPMDDLQRKALASIAGDEFVDMIIKTGEERTKELEDQGIAFKSDETAADQQTEEQEVAVEAKSEEEPQVQQLEETNATEAESLAEEAKGTEGAEPAASGEDEVQEPDSQTKAISALAQQIVAGLNLGDLAQAIKSIQETVGTIAANQVEQDGRIKALEDIGGEELSPLIPLPHSAYYRASRLAQTEPEEGAAAKARPRVPDAIVEMAKFIPV